MSKRRSWQAYALMSGDGTPMLVGCHVLKSDCPYAIYKHKDVLEAHNGKMVPVLITTIPSKRKGGKK